MCWLVASFSLTKYHCWYETEQRLDWGPLSPDCKIQHSWIAEIQCLLSSQLLLQDNGSRMLTKGGAQLQRLVKTIANQSPPRCTPGLTFHWLSLHCNTKHNAQGWGCNMQVRHTLHILSTVPVHPTSYIFTCPTCSDVTPFLPRLASFKHSLAFVLRASRKHPFLYSVSFVLEHKPQ